MKEIILARRPRAEIDTSSSFGCSSMASQNRTCGLYIHMNIVRAPTTAPGLSSNRLGRDDGLTALALYVRVCAAMLLRKQLKTKPLGKRPGSTAHVGAMSQGGEALAKAPEKSPAGPPPADAWHQRPAPSDCP